MRDGFRGYVYPLYLGICYKIGGEIGFNIINSVLVAFFFTVLFPLFNKNGTDDNVQSKYAIPLLSFILFSCFFYGLELYSLSDLMAIILCMTAVVIENKVRKISGAVGRVCGAILLGVIIYLAYNVRTIYMFAGFYIFLLFLWHIYKSFGSIKNKIISIISVFGGILLGGLPQGYMNYFDLGIFSIKVPTSGLMLSQVYWGIQYQRYDTYIGIKQIEQHPSPQMYFLDTVGQALINKDGISDFSSWGDFFLFVFKHPVEVAGIYIRHLTNGLMPCWPGMYVTDLDNNKIILSLLAYILLFLCGVIILNKCIKNYNIFTNYFALLIPVIFIIPGAVEARFFAAVYLAAIGILCYNTNKDKLKKYICLNWMKTIIVFMIIGGFLTALWSNMLVSENYYSIFWG